jgi:hypothetical protein
MLASGKATGSPIVSWFEPEYRGKGAGMPFELPAKYPGIDLPSFTPIIGVL